MLNSCFSFFFLTPSDCNKFFRNFHHLEFQCFSAKVLFFNFSFFAKEVKTFTSILRNYFNLDQMTMIRLCDTTVMNTDKHIFWVFSVCLPLIFSMWIVNDFGRDFHELNYPTIFFVWFVLMFSALVTQRHNKSKQKKMLYSDFLNKENVNI